MQEVPIERVEPTMRLACRICNNGGDVVADVGEAVTQNIVDRCEKLGIYSVHVFGNPLPDIAPSYDAARCFERVPDLFRNFQDNVFMRTLEAFLKKHFHERM